MINAKTIFQTLLVSAPLIAAGCASGPSTSSRLKVNAMLVQGNYAGVDTYLDTVKDSQYGKKNMVLYYLDKGAVQQLEGKYQDSDHSLDLAEKQMENLYTTSISKTGGMLLLNDNTVDYAGEPFERTITNVMRALNYILLGQPEEALVESKKVEEFLSSLHKNSKSHYNDDAFARYLDAMLYADQGQMDDARISLDAAKAAYADYQAVYGMPEPKFDLPKSSPNDGELVLIHYNGLAPRKVSKTEQVAWGHAMVLVRSSDDPDAGRARNAMTAAVMGNAITVAYPVIAHDTYSVVASEVWVDSKPAGSTILMEDIQAIAAKDLDDRKAAIWSRAIARAAIKYVLAQVAYKAAAQGCDQLSSPFNLVCKGVAKATLAAAVAASEVADTRGWSTLPAQIRMARLKVPVGKHDVVVLFKNAMGQVVSQQSFPGVQIASKKRRYLAARSSI